MLRLRKFVTCYLPGGGFARGGATPNLANDDNGGRKSWLETVSWPPGDGEGAADDVAVDWSSRSSVARREPWLALEQQLLADLPEQTYAMVLNWRVQTELNDDGDSVGWRSDAWRGELLTPVRMEMDGATWSPGMLGATWSPDNAIFVMMFRFLLVTTAGGADLGPEDYAHALVVVRRDQRAAVICTTAPLPYEQFATLNRFVTSYALPLLLGDDGGSYRSRELDLSKLAMRLQLLMFGRPDATHPEAVQVALYFRTLHYCFVEEQGDVETMCMEFPLSEMKQWNAALRITRASDCLRFLHSCVTATTAAAEDANADADEIKNQSFKSAPKSKSKSKSKKAGDSKSKSKSAAPKTKTKYRRILGTDWSRCVFADKLRAMMSMHARNKTRLLSSLLSSPQDVDPNNVHLLCASNIAANVSSSSTSSHSSPCPPVSVIVLTQSDGTRTTNILSPSESDQFFGHAYHTEYLRLQKRLPAHSFWSQLRTVFAGVREKEATTTARPVVVFCPLFFLDADATIAPKSDVKLVTIARKNVGNGNGDEDEEPKYEKALLRGSDSFLQNTLRHALWMVFWLDAQDQWHLHFVGEAPPTFDLLVSSSDDLVAMIGMFPDTSQMRVSDEGGYKSAVASLRAKERRGRRRHS